MRAVLSSAEFLRAAARVPTLIPMTEATASAGTISSSVAGSWSRITLTADRFCRYEKPRSP